MKIIKNSTKYQFIKRNQQDLDKNIINYNSKPSALIFFKSKQQIMIKTNK